jgi:hypothetical protein
MVLTASKVNAANRQATPAAYAVDLASPPP